MTASAPMPVSSGVPQLAAERLEAREVRVHFEGVKALDGIDLVLERGELLGVIGPNGAGKTTLVNTLTGFQRPTSGQVLVGDTDVTGRRPEHLSKLGVGRTFQGLRMFRRLTVFENVEAAAVGAGLRRRAARERAAELLDRAGLSDRARQYPGSLPLGIERMLGIVRALATEPRFLLLDEPAAGMDESETDELLERIAAIRTDFSCGVLVIEHDMRLIMRLCERIQVLNYGQTLAVGTPEVVRTDPAVIAAYLGTERGSADASAE
jgi:branched-chain amino acid transport system ATP-binding protein